DLRRVTGLPGRQPHSEVLEAAERARRLGQLRLPGGRGLPRFEIGTRQMGHQRADLVQIRNRLVRHDLLRRQRAIDRVGTLAPTQAEIHTSRHFPPHPRLLAGEGLVRESRAMARGFVVATAFLTRIPVAAPGCSAGQLADAAWAFPLVGAGIGAAAAFAFLLAQLVGLGDWPAALLAVLTGIALTGALHEDGLGDAADGLIGGRDRDHALAVMRDSRLGTFGMLAIVASVLLRSAALAGIGDAVH